MAGVGEGYTWLLKKSQSWEVAAEKFGVFGGFKGNLRVTAKCPRGRLGGPWSLRLRSFPSGVLGAPESLCSSPPYPMPQGDIQGVVPCLRTFLTQFLLLEYAMPEYLDVSCSGARVGWERGPEAWVDRSFCEP